MEANKVIEEQSPAKPQIFGVSDISAGGCVGGAKNRRIVGKFYEEE